MKRILQVVIGIVGMWILLPICWWLASIFFPHAGSGGNSW